MNRIASRALILLVLVLALTAGVAFFLGEFFAEASDWVLFSGSPHIYSGGKVVTVLTDRDGTVLADLSGNRTYAQTSQLRRAVLHWVGDREGNISTPYLSYYAKEISGYDLLNGVYTYGDTGSQTELTLSASVQEAALAAMGDYHGTVAVYNYQTGEILCAVSTPAFDPDNVPDIGEDTEGTYDGVYVNRFVQSVYIPGSIFKIATLAAALEMIPDIQEKTFYCQQVYEMEGGSVTCEKWHGEQDLKSALANSCNCAFAQIVEMLGGETLERYVEQFQLTQPVSFDGITTASGNFDITDAAAVDVAWSGIGQHMDEINPCRYLTFLGAIAGGGSGVEPYIVSKITVGGKTTYTASAGTTGQLMSQATAEILKEYLRNDVEASYGADNFPGLTVCAKSGTAEVGSDQKPNAMFTGFVADAEYPLAFIVAVEDGGYGKAVCIPILSQVLAACKAAMDG